MYLSTNHNSKRRNHGCQNRQPSPLPHTVTAYTKIPYTAWNPPDMSILTGSEDRLFAASSIILFMAFPNLGHRGVVIDIRICCWVGMAVRMFIWLERFWENYK